MKHFTLMACWAAAGWAQEPPEAMELARSAYELARGGDFDKAAAGLREAARLAPANPLYRSALGGLFERQGKFEEAHAAFSAAAKLDPVNATLRQRVETLALNWGAALAREKKYRAGLALAKRTAASYPQSAGAQQMLGLMAARNQQNVAAVAAYRRALALDPESADASVGLGIALSQAGRDSQAMEVFEAGLKRFPKDAMHRQAYGALMAKLSETGAIPRANAISMLEGALRMDAKLGEAHYQLGKLALAGGDAAAAKTHFEAAARNGLDDARLHYGAARAFRRLGREADADREFLAFEKRKAAEEQP